MKIGSFLVIALILQACASSDKREFIDSSTGKDNPPEWARSTKTTWEAKNSHLYRASQTVRGNEQTSGCYDLAKLNVKEKVLSEIANDVRGRIDNAQQSISENAETVLGKVRSGEFKGRLVGLKFSEEYFERYRISSTERIDCHVLAEISNADYNEVKRSVVNEIVQVDPKIKEAITKKQIDFFEGN